MLNSPLWNPLSYLKPSISNPATPRLKHSMTAFDRTWLGKGAIIGAGIWVLTGVVDVTQAELAVLRVITWIRFIIWMTLGILIYFIYDYAHSKFNSGQSHG